MAGAHIADLQRVRNIYRRSLWRIFMKCFLSRRTRQHTHLLAELLMALLRKLKAHARQIVVIMTPRPALGETHPKSLAHVTQVICQRERGMYILIIILPQIALESKWDEGELMGAEDDE